MIVAGTIIKTVAGFVFDTKIGKSLAAGSLVVAAFFIWLWTHDAKVAEAAKTEIVTSINTETKEITDAGVKAREGANAPGAWDRLRRNHCRDC